MSKISKALMSLLLDKRARSALEENQAAPKSPNTPKRIPRQAHHQTQTEIKQQLDSKIDEIHNRPEKKASLSRQEIIAEAQRVRAAKQTVLEELSKEQRLKLQVIAMKAMMPNKTNAPDN
ncbi:MAG: hypothetical protein OQK24_05365 [Magnetovibrio sp.]|nr:hypothetical protein [Magnetovibrio sp.]